MQLIYIALIGLGAAGFVSLFAPLSIKAGRALQQKIQPEQDAAARSGRLQFTK
jgi:hypothetical protein